MPERPDLPECLKIAIGLRIPLFKEESPKGKIDALESYLLLTAWYQGELAEERLNRLCELRPLEEEWNHLAGWESLKQTRTEKGVMDAKRRLRPDLYDEMTGLQWMVKRLDEEADRLERDATKTSRVYSMITGS